MALGLAATVQAATIDGGVAFSGTYTQNGGTPGMLTTANSFSISSWTVVGNGATFAGITGANVTSLYSTYNVFQPFPGVPNSPLSPSGQQMWDINIGTIGYAFNVTSETQSYDSAHSSLTMGGAGNFIDSLGDSVAGTWQLGFGVSGATFSFQDTAATNVPDGGMTVMLLGAALSGLALIRRKLA
jgi:hypothetical protein